MATKRHPLLNGWYLIAHPTFKVYSNNNCYIVLDWDDDVVIRFAVLDHEIEVFGGSWNLNYKINLGFKTIKIVNEPEKEH
ncbi:hypothetical protein [Bacillus sp. T33-2]|uniref:hypothetical protein n=1 Tax=Bacillus sp. T33-2 TaxID=2054168 RepID=UPI000C76CDE7|nr:hypothetical protein [Bacillus sp. T33-2]PLR94171.1 hypothetical protein CVD19_17990 [Bacillus sp. T33-2]